MNSIVKPEQQPVLLSSQLNLKSRLYEHKLVGFAECYEEQCINPAISQGLSFEERLSACLTRQEEYERRQTCERLIRNANFRDHLTLNEIAKSPTKGLNSELLRELSGTSWVEHGTNIAITGGCGVGKTALACAVGRSLAWHGIGVLYYRTSDLLLYIKGISERLALARAYKKLARIKVLILDDFGIHGAYSDDDIKILLDLADQRYSINPIIICSQYRMGGFYSLFPQNSGSESLLDRLLHPCLEIPLEGDSRRGTVLQASL